MDCQDQFQKPDRSRLLLFRNRFRPAHPANQAFGAQIETMQESPGDKRPPRPVPKATQQESYEKIPIGAQIPLFGTSQRDIEIVAEPA